MLTQAGLTLASMIPNAINSRELSRRTPNTKSTKYARRKIDKAFDKHVDDISPGREIFVDVAQNYPKATDAFGAFNEARNNKGAFASSTKVGEQPGVDINPNADRVYYAHELGHLASQATDVGHFVNTLRANPKLATALGVGLFTLPGIAAAAEAGDDDLDTSIALAALASAPTLVDESLATIHGQKILNKAGLRTDLGQRGKLAGGLLSYLAPAVIAGVGGNIAGNLLDEDPGMAQL